MALLFRLYRHETSIGSSPSAVERRQIALTTLERFAISVPKRRLVGCHSLCSSVSVFFWWTCVCVSSVAVHLVERYAVLDEGMQRLQDALLDAALNGSTGANEMASPTFRSPFDTADRELVRESGAISPLVVQLLDGVLSFNDTEVRGGVMGRICIGSRHRWQLFPSVVHGVFVRLQMSSVQTTSAMALPALCHSHPVWQERDSWRAA